MSDSTEKTEGELISEKLTHTLKSCWETISPEEKIQVIEFSEEYKRFLDKARTSELFTSCCVSELMKHGFTNIEELIKNTQASAKVYQTIKGNSLFFAIPGKQPVTKGVNIICSHSDSPYIGLKSNPLYENSDLAFFDTQYYGGIKYYQWTAIPLIMLGTIIDKDGVKKHIQLGCNNDEPVFTITDLLPHLAGNQMKKNASEFIDAESLDILIGSEPFHDKKISDKVKLNILSILHEKYGIFEKSFAHIDISFVPAFNARDVGFDRSMIGAYGHDDKCCAFASLQAALQFVDSAENSNNLPEKTIVCLFIDREEVRGHRPYIQYFKYFLQGLCPEGIDPYRVLSLSSVISADVNAAFDPNYASVYDSKNSSFLGRGIAITRSETGNFANMEYSKKIQDIFDANQIKWQYGGWGKQDKGGAGTLARDIVEYSIDTIDCGIPVLSMHSPFEVISKLDLWMAYKSYKVFFSEV